MDILTHDGHSIPWGNSVRYLGVFIVQSRLVNLNVLLITQNVLFIDLLMQYSARLDGQLHRKYFYRYML